MCFDSFKFVSCGFVMSGVFHFVLNTIMYLYMWLNYINLLKLSKNWILKNNYYSYSAFSSISYWVKVLYEYVYATLLDVIADIYHRIIVIMDCKHNYRSFMDILSAFAIYLVSFYLLYLKFDLKYCL